MTRRDTNSVNHTAPKHSPLVKQPTEEMCREARGFIMGLDLGIRNWQDMEKHLDRGGYSCLPYIREMAAQGQGGHITKWDVADCIWQLMARAHPVPVPAPTAPLIERVAFELWRDESIRAATRPRSWGQWLDQSDDTHSRWRRAAQAAIAACHAEELREALRDALGGFKCTQRVEHYPQDHWSQRAVALLAKLDGQL